MGVSTRWRTEWPILVTCGKQSEKNTITRIHPRGGGAPFEKLELAFRNVLTQNTIGIFIGGVIVLHIVFFDEEYVKFSSGVSIYFPCSNTSTGR